MGLVQAIARQTARSGADDFADRFGQRLQALAAGQDLLVQNAWSTVPLADLIRSQLGHFSDLFGVRIETAGPPVSLRPDAAQAIGMAFHELATNAAKYGALSNEGGRILVGWSVERETAGGPFFCRSNATGRRLPDRQPRFGTRVTTELVEASVDGEVSVVYARTACMAAVHPAPGSA
jgi:two-component sensor histidine kinase